MYPFPFSPHPPDIKAFVHRDPECGALQCLCERWVDPPAALCTHRAFQARGYFLLGSITKGSIGHLHNLRSFKSRHILHSFITLTHIPLQVGPLKSVAINLCSSSEHEFWIHPVKIFNFIGLWWPELMKVSCISHGKTEVRVKSERKVLDRKCILSYKCIMWPLLIPLY